MTHLFDVEIDSRSGCIALHSPITAPHVLTMIAEEHQELPPRIGVHRAARPELVDIAYISKANHEK
jgi:hypothetical protein